MMIGPEPMRVVGKGTKLWCLLGIGIPSAAKAALLFVLDAVRLVDHPRELPGWANSFIMSVNWVKR